MSFSCLARLALVLLLGVCVVLWGIVTALLCFVLPGLSISLCLRRGEDVKLLASALSVPCAPLFFPLSAHESALRTLSSFSWPTSVSHLPRSTRACVVWVRVR